MSNYGSAELAVLLSHLSAPSTERGADPERPATASEAMALYFVAARLVELQLELAARGQGQDLSAELATTRQVLEGTRQALLAALDAAEIRDGAAERIPGPPSLSLVEGGRLRKRRGKQNP